jgi:hypothetical protein
MNPTKYTYISIIWTTFHFIVIFSPAWSKRYVARQRNVVELDKAITSEISINDSDTVFLVFVKEINGVFDL